MVDKRIESCYVPLDAEAAFSEHGEYVQDGEFCHVDGLKTTFAWMRGFVNGWYGWSNDGKGTMLDFLSLLMAKHEGWKFCMYRQEDMDSVMKNGKPVIKANRIYKNLAWSYTGKTWNKRFSERYYKPLMTLDEEQEALEFVSKHFFVIQPQNRKFKTLMDDMMFMYEKFGIDVFTIDPWNTVQLPPGERGDERLVNAFIDVKEFALKTNSVFNIVNHAKSMNDVKDKDGRYKVVNQFMQLGGSAWDMKMDGQYSIYRPERHLNPKDPKVHFHNLKQRQAEVVGVERGSYEKIEFDFHKKQYYFDGINPMTGEVKPDKFKQGTVDYTEPKKKDTPPSDDVPF
jgi:hypothetical protein